MIKDGLMRMNSPKQFSDNHLLQFKEVDNQVETIL
jgi:hypothetical protein